MSEAVPTTTRRKAYDASIQALGSTILHGVEGSICLWWTRANKAW